VERGFVAGTVDFGRHGIDGLSRIMLADRWPVKYRFHRVERPRTGYELSSAADPA
jgi:hypothetical protein